MQSFPFDMVLFLLYSLTSENVSFPHLQNCYILILYKHVCWILLGIVRKAAKHMRLITVETLQGMQFVSMVWRVHATAAY